MTDNISQQLNIDDTDLAYSQLLALIRMDYQNIALS
ncbi:hypothetical protein O6P42_07180 [Vibrio alginolyticus]|nr:hypothetical protein [Vibrio alginolyticus]WED61277.1 hypothetical protein O6P42_07180 [Vibrio alginolyticus]